MKRAVHKPYAFAQPALGVVCGAYPFCSVAKIWRGVTCKNCLRVRLRKRAAPGAKGEP